MASYNKSFNFRNGVQVDNDNFIVNANGLVGIGTSIPREFLDVYGTAKVTGLVTTTDLYVSGIATFNQVKIGTGITISSSSGIISATTFYGSAAGLTGIYAIAVDGWYVTSGSISTTSKVGIATTNPQYYLQVGQSPDSGYGFGVNPTGDVKTTGIITASQIFISKLNVSGVSTFQDSAYFGDDDTIYLGNSNNVKISYNSASTSGIISTFNNLGIFGGLDVNIKAGYASTISIGSTLGTSAVFTNGLSGSVELYYGGFKKFETLGVGATLTGTLFSNSISVSGVVTAQSFRGSLTSTDLTGTIDNARLPSNISVGIVTASTSFYGNLVGTATTASNLTGTPNITVGSINSSNINCSNINSSGIITATKIIADSIEVIEAPSGITTVAKTLNVGTGGTGFSALSSGRIGVGTGIPTAELQIIKSSESLLEVISNSGQSRISIGQVTGVGNSTAVLRFGNSPKTFDIINNDTGNINSYLHAGAAGINTGRFAWIYGQDGSEKMSLTYDGNLGIGATIPTNTLHVVGTSTVTGSSYVGGNIEILGSFNLGSGSNKSIINPSTNSILNNVNLNVTVGVSTVATVLVSSGSSIGIGTNRAIVGLDARNQIGLINTLGIATNIINAISGNLYNQGSTVLVDTVGIGTTSIFVDQNYPSGSLQVFGQIRVESGGDITLSNYGFIGINSLAPIAAIDARYASYNSTYRTAIYPPILTTTERTTITGASLAAAGAIIYNSTTGNHQAYDGSSWQPIGLTGTQNISVGIVTATSLNGNLIGNVTGIASTALSLSGTPNITVGVITATKLVIGAAGTTITTNNNSVGIGTTNPQGILDLVSTTSAFYLPRMTTAQ